MAMRRGLVQPSPTALPPKPAVHNIRARIIEPKPATPEPSRIVDPNARPQPPIRGAIVDAGGKKLIRGLSQATVQAHQAYTETASEQCRNCGEFKPPAEFQTPVKNAYNPNNPLRICNACAKLAYKDPYQVEAKRIDPWKPFVPQIRFDRERGVPYDARAAGLSIGDLVNDNGNRDAYHKERDVAPEFRVEQAPRYGQWSGAGRTGHPHTAASLENSRERAQRRR